MNEPVPGVITPQAPAPQVPPAPPAPQPNAAANPTAYGAGGQTEGASFGQYVAIVLIGLTFVNLILQISLSRKQHTALKSSTASKDDKVNTDIKELKLNVKKMLGDKYEQLTS
jgi:hypothetical protein